MRTNESLVSALRQAARDLTATRSIRDVDQTLSEIVHFAVETVPGVEAGGITVIRDGVIESRDPTHPAVTELDQLQSELEEGPCITAVEDPPEDGIVVAQDLEGPDAERWPQFAPRAVKAGYRAMMSSQLSHEPGPLRAALNLYAGGPDAFDADSRLTAGLFGVQAAMLLHGSEQAADLQRAVASRDVIGQAKGILMERFTVDDDAAFRMLVRSSQDTNLKLVEVARWLHDEANRRSTDRGAAHA
ncbi:GAF and ANTAR domain-containing protein [Actinomycetospora lemnae]|uniref:GAF and ANTAR domain-containing protein n=1 Tax=Actinomycetospora lemnae TaxID=3019891 RepID=A0ABT5SMA8_9PSEU|nr:GAF and ANTAR domain-containing protein [Actinomycetospora sp. DW7H6]MDD7963971.1 GAF and ANTAR domain-containing protein [Actinomycetospora sp. DW7H6]